MRKLVGRRACAVQVGCDRGRWHNSRVLWIRGQALRLRWPKLPACEYLHWERLMRWLALTLLGALLCGCTSYNEWFTYVDPNTGSTNHTVHISYRSFLMWGESAKLKTETQTMEFIRTVNADGLVIKPDADSIKSIADGIVQSILNAASQGAVP